MVVRLRNDPSDAGFSLLELMVVVAILSVLSVGVTLGLSRGANPAARAADALQAAAAEARSLAMLTGAAHAIEVTPDGWRVAREGAEGWVALSRGGWSGVATESAERTVRFVIDGDGAATGGPVTLSASNGRRTCRVGPAARLECG